MLAEEFSYARSGPFSTSQNDDWMIAPDPAHRRMTAMTLNSDYEADIRPHLRRRYKSVIELTNQMKDEYKDLISTY